MSYTEEQQWALEQFDALELKLGSQNKACQMVGIAAAIMSPLRKGAYQGNADVQFDKLISYFRTKEEAMALPAHNSGKCGYVPTSISQQIYDIIRNCQLRGGMALACGDSGIGKTMGARKFADDHFTDAVYLTLNPCLTSLKSTLKQLCQRLNVTEKTIDEMWFGLTSKLRDGMVIIIDEAQHVPIKTIETLRALPDYFESLGQTLGVVFIGNTHTINKFGGKKEADFEQIANRTWPKKRYTTSHIRKSDIKMLFPERNDMEIDFLFEFSQEPKYGIRGAVKIFNRAVDNGNATYDGIVAAAKEM